MLRMPILIATAAAVLAAGCTSAAPPTGAPTGGTGAATPVAGTPVPVTPAATPGGDPGASTAAATVADMEPHDFPELEALLPSEVAGVPIQKASFNSETGGVALSDEFTAAMQQFGRSETDVQLASAGPAGDSDRDLTILAFRIVGVDATQFLAALRTITDANPETEMGIGDATVAGKSVLTLTQNDVTQYAYASGEVFFIVGGEQELIEATLTQLP